MPLHVWLICGLPGAGKTTLAKRMVEMARDCDSVDLRVDFISFDDLFTQPQDALEFDPVAWKQCQRRMAQRVKAQLQAVEQHDGDSGEDTVLLVDDNMQLRSMRKRFFYVASEAECSFGILYVSTPTEICRERNEARGQSDRVPTVVFQRMADAFEPPDQQTCAFEANLVTFENDACLEDCIQTLLANAKRLKQENSAKAQENAQKEQMRKSDQELTSKSVMHLLDLALRQWISGALVASTEKRHEAERLNRHRKAFLSDLKRKPVDMQSNSAEAIVAHLMQSFQRNVQSDTFSPLDT